MRKISVLMSVYQKDSPIFLRQALNSIFSQTIQPAEIVLIKDGPLTSELDAVISEYSVKYPIFNILINKENLGLGLSLAKGVLACSNEYIARMDADDDMHPTRFEKQLLVLDKGYDVVSCWSKTFQYDIKEKGIIRKRPENHADIVKFAHQRSPIGHSSCMYKKTAVLMAGNYRNKYLYEDYHLWVRMIMSGAKFYNIQEVLFYYRVLPGLYKRRGGIKYMINEIRVFLYFYNIGFYSIFDFLKNILTHSPLRILPNSIRAVLLKFSWKYNK